MILGRIRGQHLRIGILLYVALLLASNWAHNARWSGYSPRTPRQTSQVLATDDSGPLEGSPYKLAYIEWTPENPIPGAPAVVMLHGSPGAASSFNLVAPQLAEAGYRVIALDLPGFGVSTQRAPSYSILAHAHIVLGFLDEHDLDRAHILGFSMGGGVAVHMADMAPQRVASMILLSSIGVQEAEGSGDYYFEHAKYAIGIAGLGMGVRELVPDFGILGPRTYWYSFFRNFWDTDQRPIRAIMESLDVPTLIIHGRDDFLVPAWGAELHHQLIEPSSLVMLDTGHFREFLFEKPELSVEHIVPFLSRHSDAGAEPLRFSVDLAPTGKDDITLDSLGPFSLKHTTPWWIVVLAIILGTFISEDATVIAVGVLVARGEVDFFVGLMGCFTGIVLGDGGLWAIGRFAGRRALDWPLIGKWIPDRSLARWGRWFDKHAVKAVLVARAMPGLRLPTYLAAGMLSRHTATFLFWAAVAAVLWTPMLLILAATIGSSIMEFLEGTLSGPLAVLAAIILLLILLRLFEMTLTWTGRRRLLRLFHRVRQPEFWPSWLCYMMILPHVARLAIKHGPMTFSCANPGISHGGGIVGESKIEILRSLKAADDLVLPWHHVPTMHDPIQRAAFVDGIVESDEDFSYPVIVKPNESQRSFGVKLARTRQDLDRYFESMTRDAIVQAFHPGPHEIGILWARDRTSEGLADSGRLISITRKEFPMLTGDGRSTLERLIWKHPRYRMQAEVFLERHEEKQDLVLGKGETLRLANSGNHCQGTMFKDGGELDTEALRDRLTRIVQNFEGQPNAQGEPGAFDFGRFDIRYEDEEALRRGEGFAIIELNGTTSESTHIYDPSGSLVWMHREMRAHWTALYEIGARRRKEGIRPVRVRELLTHVRDHYQTRSGDPIAD
jgi:pimeloyl-ACP methyl ester carboxylesterase/membrane protein DedA with SNARE-associated domain